MRLKYVHEYIDRTGTVRRYFRRRGFPKLALPGLPGSREFREAYEAGLQAEPPPKAAKGGPGSLSDLVTTWCRSPHFANLSPSSQATYRKVLKPILEKHGHRLAHDLPHDKAMKIIVQIGETRPGLANLTKSVLHTIFNFARIVPNPFADIGDYKTSHLDRRRAGRLRSAVAARYARAPRLCALALHGAARRRRRRDPPGGH